MTVENQLRLPGVGVEQSWRLAGSHREKGLAVRAEVERPAAVYVEVDGRRRLAGQRIGVVHALPVRAIAAKGLKPLHVEAGAFVPQPEIRRGILDRVGHAPEFFRETGSQWTML